MAIAQEAQSPEAESELVEIDLRETLESDLGWECVLRF